MNNLDWELLRSFLSVARFGSLSAAARHLGLSQPTLSRNIQALEKSTRIQLFQRSPQGLKLTDAGSSLIDAAERMEQASELFLRQVSGLSDQLVGDIRISANEIVGFYLLPPAITAFSKLHPGVQIELVIANEASSLNKREADIALRMFRPTQLSLVARRLPNLSLAFYAHRDYLCELGKPESVADLAGHRLIGFDQHLHFMQLGLPDEIEIKRHDFALRTDSILAQIQLLRAGAGITVTHTGLARYWPELESVMSWLPLPELEFWIVCHSDTQYSARIRTLTAFLADWFVPDPYAQIGAMLG
jgi:DNA-binding transcriptional LysR family regulator